MTASRLAVLAAVALAVVAVPVAGTAPATPDRAASPSDASPALQQESAQTNVSLEVSSGTVAPGENVTVLVRAFHEGPGNATNLTVTLADLPDGWEVVDQDPNRDGTYAAGDAAWTWDRTPPREFATVSVTLRAPEDVATDASATVAVTVEGDAVASQSLALSPPSTTTAETTTDGTTAASTDDEPTTTGDDGETPGFGVGLAGLALAAVALVAARRR